MRSRLPLRLVVALLALTFAFAPRIALAAWPGAAMNLPICTTAPDQGLPCTVCDGAGGAIIAFAGVYAQHATAGGAVDPAWPLNGGKLSTSVSTGTQPSITTDGAGGAIVAWQEFRVPNGIDIYPQHVLASGVVEVMCPTDRRALVRPANPPTIPPIATAGAAVSIVACIGPR